MKGFQTVPRIGSEASRIIIVSALAAVLISAAFLAYQVTKLDVNTIETKTLSTIDEISGTAQTTLGEWWKEYVDIIPNDAFAEETSDYDAAIAEARDTYNEAIIEAKAAYYKVLSDENADSEERAKASLVYTQSLLDAKEAYDNAISEIKAKYNVESNSETTYSTFEEARDDYLKAIADAKIAYEKALGEATNDEEVSAAKQAFNKAILDAQTAYEKAKAALEK